MNNMSKTFIVSMMFAATSAFGQDIAVLGERIYTSNESDNIVTVIDTREPELHAFNLITRDEALATADAVDAGRCRAHPASL